MPIELEEFHQEFFQEVQRAADAAGRFAEDAFFDLFCEQLVDAGELETADRAHYLGAKGIRIDGYGGDPAAAEGTLSLIIADFDQSPEITTLTATEMDAIFKRATAFLTKALDPSFRNSLEETSPGFGLADLVASSWNVVTKVRIFLITNRKLSSRVDGRAAGELDGTPILYNVWDLNRLYRFETSGRSREEIMVDMDEHGGPVAALPAHLTDAGYEAYLLVIPGSQLASIYERWGARLLEQNVRVFLQARNTVNKGIKNTIENDPNMFFAYNNGLTATAEEVISRKAGAGIMVTGLRNLQIVNGGQTTASIYAASNKPGVDLSRVFVQMKLSVIPADRAEGVVPKISEFANSQNKVSAADFFANHPFHLRMKDLSQRIFAPSPDGAFRQSKWFYERARGQYQDARGNLSVAERRQFDLEYPKRQVFTKTDLGKFLNLWLGHPDIVSKGAQKNFADFAAYMGKAWAENPDQFNEVFYRHAIAKAIVFHETEALVTKQPWYDGGYRAQVVAYAIAKIAHDVGSLGGSVDFDRIWRAQGVSDALRAWLTLAAEVSKDVLIDPPPGAKNVTEWAKKSACWTRIQEKKVNWPRQFLDELLTGEEEAGIQRSAARDQKVWNGIEAQSAVVSAGADTWRLIKTWANEKRLLSGKELEILEAAAAMLPSRIPSEKQSLVIMKSLRKLREEGCPIRPDIG